MKNIPIQTIKKRAIDLIEPSDGLDVNREYTRGICELIADIDGKPDIPLHTRSKEVAIELGVHIDIANNLW